METSELATMAVAFLAATATGAAGAVGQGAGTAVTEMLRDRLSATDRGQGALAALDRSPEDPAARDAARSLVQEEIEADPELHRRLRQRLAPSTTVTAGSMLITGSRVSRSPISFGPLTINRTKEARGAVDLVAALLLVIVVLAVYGGVKLIAVGGPGPSSEDGRTVRALSLDEVRRVVPDLASMPDGWKRASTVEAWRDEEKGCAAARARFRSAYGRDNDGTVVYAAFTVLSCPTAERSAEIFGASRSAVAMNKGNEEAPLPELGDERFAVAAENPDLEETTARALVRVGTVLAELEYALLVDDPEATAEFEQLATTVADRAQQVQNG